MRAREFIVEYDRGMTLKSWEQKLTSRIASDQSAPDSIDEIMEMIESADPTRNKVYAQWIVKRYVAGDYNASDLDQVNLRLTDYDSVKKSLTSGKDINQLTYAQLPDIIQAGRAQKSAPKFEIIPDTEVLYNGPDGQLAIPRTEEASRELGKGTAWCTAYTDRPTLFDDYNSSGNLYTWRAKNGDKFQFFWGDDIQFMNSANKPLSPKDMHFYRSINPPTKQLFAKYEDKFLEENNKDRVIKLFDVLHTSQAVWEKATEYFSTDAELAYKYTLATKKKFPAGEPAIATSAEWSFKYAEILNQPFPAGEPAIATSPWYSFSYAHMLDKPFPAGEPAIATDAEISYYYAEMLGKPFPAGEPAIASDAQCSFEYAEMLDRPFPAGEAAIATSPQYSVEYAKLLHKSFPAGEPAIANSTNYAREYTYKIVKKYGSDTWENVIKDNANVAVVYAEMLDKPFPAGEPVIAKYAHTSVNYARILDKPFPAGEPVIATSRAASLNYAKVIKKRFPAGEPAIATDATYAKEYDEMFGTNLSQQ